MRIGNVFILVFLLSAFAIGVSLQDGERQIVDSAIDNASFVINNITLDYNSSSESSIPNMAGFFTVIEKYIKFVGTLAMEVFRAGVYFGQDNPEYFSPLFIINIVRMLLILMLVSLLIRPVFYIVVLLIMAFISLKEVIDKRNKKKNNQITEKEVLEKNE